MREYSGKQTLLANLPYTLMLLTGAGTIALAFVLSRWAWTAAAGYLAYGIAGAGWIMIFVCPYCAFYGTRGCPCGYGMISATLVRKGAVNCFSAKFKRHIPVIVPLWLIPMVCGAIGLLNSFSWPLSAILAAFALNSFVLLPLVSKRHSCADCPQKADCPWMARTAAT
jgi:hypothetical protein